MLTKMPQTHNLIPWGPPPNESNGINRRTTHKVSFPLTLGPMAWNTLMTPGQDLFKYWNMSGQQIAQMPLATTALISLLLHGRIAR